MTDVEASFEDFSASRRTGRRNAIYEIPQGLGGPGPAESDAAASRLSGNKPGDEEQDVAETEDTAAAEEETQAEGS
ncbi:cAMP-dependent protein kinase inhibitor alpha [Nelusetta ayraudi]|uniref:cAMP-dependent protein kinase inhibitor alpha n=1 Tax=Nelusetta ayraudi TaxID=303726 RepID=UPI003F6FEC21